MLNVQQKFKATPVGDIPVDWECVRIETLVQSLKAGVSVNGTKNSEQTNQVAVLKVSAVTEGEFKPEQSKTVIQEDLHRVKTPVTADRIIISRSNSQSLVGASAYVSRDYPDLYLSDKLWEIDCNELTQNKFLSIVLASGRLRYRLSNLATGTSGSMKNISQGDLTTLPIALPPLAEQQKIADILGTGDRAIDTQRKLITALTQRKKALAQQLLTGKTRLPGFEEPWHEVKLGDYFKERKERNFNDLSLLAITARDGIVDRDSLTKSDTSNSDKSKYLRIIPGDIGYNTMRMWQGVSGLSTLEGIVSPAYTILIPSGIDPAFSAFLFKFPELIFKFKRYSQGMVDDTLSLKYPAFEIIKTLIPPSLSEQTAIAKVLTTADRELALHTQHLTTLQTQKRALMQQLLTGKVRVSV